MSGTCGIQKDMLRRARASGDEFIEAKALAVLAQYALDEGRVDEDPSQTSRRPTATIASDGPTDRCSHAILICRFARALALSGHRSKAVAGSAAAQALSSGWGAKRSGTWVARMNDETLELVQPHLDDGSRRPGTRGRLTADEAAALALELLE